ncbi:store-operated calcium entry-associated regulatory factor-like [Lineus longissimus]|uniref:store-operated calcium entry-associated regulatory factor-like n=1 Tax=Lineus longissimus TaxID=88925 RepID=UPI002B4E9529
MKKLDMINEISVFLAFAVGLMDIGYVFAVEKIKLSDIMVLTLYNGRMTNARRSGPIPQLKCTGGSAGCSSYVPQVVQCYNRGSDGYDVQWECKTDMDNAFRFGRVEVSCEGYDYPNDPYVLRGSCGCEYTLDLTKEGYQKRKNRNHEQHHRYYDDDGYDHHDNSYSYDGHNSYTSYQKSGSGLGDIIMLVIIGLIIYAIYKTCSGNNQMDYEGQGSVDNDSDDRPSGGYRRNNYGGGGGSPPGYSPGYMPGGGGCGGTPHGTGAGGGGFWSGAATGGILGYLLGNTGRRNTGYGGYGYARPYSSWGSGWGSSGFGSGFGRASFGGGSSGSSSYSSGTRSASGFGGTRRR